MAKKRKAGAFVVRDFRIESGYKTAFLIRIVDSMMLLVLFYFLSQLITPHTAARVIPKPRALASNTARAANPTVAALTAAAARSVLLDRTVRGTFTPRHPIGRR